MNLLEHHRNEEIVRLTQVAAQAAEQGQWDVVIRCYQDRGALLDAGSMQIPALHDLLKLDGAVRERVHTAQILLQSLIEGAETTRCQLEGLRQRLAVSSSSPGRLSFEA